MNWQEYLKRTALVEAARSEKPGVMPEDFGDHRQRQQQAQQKHLNKLRKASRAGDREASVEIARLLYADELLTNR